MSTPKIGRPSKFAHPVKWPDFRVEKTLKLLAGELVEAERLRPSPRFKKLADFARFALDRAVDEVTGGPPGEGGPIYFRITDYVFELRPKEVCMMVDLLQASYDETGDPDAETLIRLFKATGIPELEPPPPVEPEPKRKRRQRHRLGSW